MLSAVKIAHALHLLATNPFFRVKPTIINNQAERDLRMVLHVTEIASTLRMYA